MTSGSLQTTTTWAYEGIRLTGLDAARSDTATWSLEYLYDERGTLSRGIYSAEDMSAPAAEFVIKTSDNVHKVRGIYHNALMKRTPSESAVRTATEVFRTAGGTLRTREAAERGIHYSTLYGMHGAGLLEQLSRGVYRLTELQAPSKYDVVAVAERVPDAVLCLISALDFHEIGTQIPSAVSIAIGGKDWHPQFDYPRVRIYRMSGEALTAGIEEHTIDGTTVKVFNPAKTVADCFKFRNKTGLDVALEALRETVRSRKATRNEIMRYAEIDRVSKIVRPYLEAME